MEIERNIENVTGQLEQIGNWIKELGSKLFSMVLSFWLMVIAIAMGVGVPVLILRGLLHAKF